MPFLQVYSYSGRDLEAKKQAAQALVKAASEAMGAPETAFTVMFVDVEREEWEKDIREAIIDPQRDLVVYDHGELV